MNGLYINSKMKQLFFKKNNCKRKCGCCSTSLLTSLWGRGPQILKTKHMVGTFWCPSDQHASQTLHCSPVPVHGIPPGCPWTVQSLSNSNTGFKVKLGAKIEKNEITNNQQLKQIHFGNKFQGGETWLSHRWFVWENEWNPRGLLQQNTGMWPDLQGSCDLLA